jgi:fructose-bisphosphate aldolase class 1
MSESLQSIAATLVADDKGILAAEASVATSTKRFGPLGLKSIEQACGDHFTICIWPTL